MRASKLYPFSIPANGSVPLLVSGDYFKITSCTGVLSVTGDSFGTLDQVLPGQGLRDTEFQRLTLKDRTGAVNNGFLLVSDSTFVDDRITGEVSVIDGSQARTRSGIVFGAGFNVPGVAAQVPGAQLWNPPGSGKRIICPAVTIAPGTVAASIYVGITLANIAGTNVSASAIRSIYSAGGAGIGQAWRRNSAAALLTVTPYNMAQQLGLPFKHQPNMGPYVLEPGSGLVVSSGTLAGDLYVSYEYSEETIL